jgi:hypothetical protein
MHVTQSWHDFTEPRRVIVPIWRDNAPQLAHIPQPWHADAPPLGEYASKERAVVTTFQNVPQFCHALSIPAQNVSTSSIDDTRVAGGRPASKRFP